MNDELITCEACERRVKLVRSVLLRPMLESMSERFPEWNKPGAMTIKERFDGDEKRIEQWTRWYLAYMRNSEYRRAFICCECYRHFSVRYIVEDRERTFAVLMPFEVTSQGHRPREWMMSVRSAEGKAATYDYRKWLAYQKRTAAKMGIEL